MNGNIVPFVQSILEKADNPGDIEFSVVEDEAGSDMMAECFDKIRSMTRWLKVTPVTKEERIKYFGRCIEFYEKGWIFPVELTDQLRNRLTMYQYGEIPRLWFPPARNYDLSIQNSTGDVILNTPLDLVVNFNLSECYRKFKERLAPDSNLSLMFGLEQGNIVRHHGTRLFNRGLFYRLKKVDQNYSPESFSFDERWFANAFFDDDWNRRAEKIGAVSKGWEEVTGERRYLTMINSPWMPEYLSENMIENFPCYERNIRAYQLRNNE